MIGGAVAGRRQSRRQVHLCQAAATSDAVACSIVLIGQVAE